MLQRSFYQLVYFSFYLFNPANQIKFFYADLSSEKSTVRQTNALSSQQTQWNVSTR